MEVHLSAEVQTELDHLVRESGLPVGEVLEDAILGLAAELMNTKVALNRRYDDPESGRIQTIDGEQVFARLRDRRQMRV